VLAPEQIVARLEDRSRLLTGGSRTAPPRQQTLRATLGWSYDLLAPPERRLFERLAVFAGGWTLDAAEAVCGADGIEPADVLDLLTRLVDKSLVIAEPGAGGTMRFGLLETVRHYGAQRLAVRDEADAVRARHADFFIGLAEEFEPRDVGTDWTARLDRLDQEHNNLRAALRWLADRGAVAGAQRLGGALALFWFLRGYREEGRAWLAELLALPGGPARPATRAKLLFGLALLALHLGDYAAVQAPAEEALAVWRALGDRVWMAYALYVLGLLERWRGDRAQGRRRFREGLDTARVAGDRTVEAFNRRGLALVALDDGAYAEARARAEEALALARHPRSVSQALTILGEISHREGDCAAARALLEASLGKARELGERILVRVALPTLALVLVEQADHAQARALLAESLTLSRDHGDREGVGRGLEAFAHLAAAQGQPARAVRLAGAAAALREAIGAPISPSERAVLERRLAPARAALGEPASALAWAAGRAVSPDDAAAYALSEGGDSSPGASDEAPGAGRPERTRDPGRLTPREGEVAALVAEGLSNRQIAARLVISERTVESHVSNILGKLELGSRTRLAAWAVEHRLLATGRA
jgi:DNA-binding CsgD family transcriptional regulator/tetratricopeptide (TPR) repeat protein